LPNEPEEVFDNSTPIGFVWPIECLTHREVVEQISSRLVASGGVSVTERFREIRLIGGIRNPLVSFCFFSVAGVRDSA